MVNKLTDNVQNFVISEIINNLKLLYNSVDKGDFIAVLDSFLNEYDMGVYLTDDSEVEYFSYKRVKSVQSEIDKVMAAKEVIEENNVSDQVWRPGPAKNIVHNTSGKRYTIVTDIMGDGEVWAILDLETNVETTYSVRELLSGFRLENSEDKKLKGDSLKKTFVSYNKSPSACFELNNIISSLTYAKEKSKDPTTECKPWIMDLGTDILNLALYVKYLEQDLRDEINILADYQSNKVT